MQHLVARGERPLELLEPTSVEETIQILNNIKNKYEAHHHVQYSEDAIEKAVKLSERGPAEVWFGDPGQAGNDNAHLKDPRAVALDSKGHLFVADCGNNRVLVLNEKDKSFAGSLLHRGGQDP